MDLDDAWTRFAVDAAQRIGMGKLSSKLKVVWNPRLRTTAGRAWSKIACIEINPKIASFGEEEVRRTVLHELAHVVAKARHKWRRISPHGPEWRQACADLGIAGEAARHHLPIERSSQRRRYHYQCPSCEVAVKRVRKFRNKAACLNCCRQYAGGHYDPRFEFVLILKPTP